MEAARTYLFLFTDYYFATKAERILLEEGLGIQLVPTPKELSHACGLCILAYEREVEQILTLLVESHITHSGLYKKEGMTLVKVTV